MRGWAAALLVLIAGVALFWFFTGAQPDKTIVVPAAPVTETQAVARAARATAATPAQSQTGRPNASVASLGSNALETPPTSRTASYHPQPPPAVEPTPASSSLPGETVLENMRTSLRLYASMFGENPVGNNAEITKALQGENPRHANFLKSEDGNRVNSNGELVDVWGTPYFFHQLSAKEMEIRSAGPDRKMWTDDDLVTR